MESTFLAVQSGTACQPSAKYTDLLTKREHHVERDDSIETDSGPKSIDVSESDQLFSVRDKTVATLPDRLNQDETAWTVNTCVIDLYGECYGGDERHD
jgi:hypothetical protein